MLPVAGAFVGLSTLDLVYRVTGPPAAGRKVQAVGQEIAAGGPAANAAVTFAALSQAAGAPDAGPPPGVWAGGVLVGGPAGGVLGLSEAAGALGARAGEAVAGRRASGGPAGGRAGGTAGATTLVTALGRHPLAGYAAAELTSRGVTVLDATPEWAGPPAVSSAWVVQGSGERSVVSVNAGGIDAPPPASLAEVVRAAAVVLVDGHHPRLAIATASAARAAGRPVLLDGGSWKPGLDALLSLVDVAVCAAEFRLPGTDSAADSAAELRRRYGVPAVAVTAGPSPVRWWQGDPAGSPAAGEVAVPSVSAQDTLGAGDAFHGALAWAFAVADRADLATALGFAADVAAVRCETAGPRGWLADPRLADLARGWLARDRPVPA